MTDWFSLAGKTALVTGGAQGLGRMMAEALLRAGASVVVTSRKADAAREAAAQMGALGPCAAIASNLATPEAAVELARRYAEQVGRCDILVNNAGKTWGSPLESFADKAWPDLMAVNVQAPFTLVRELLPLLKAAARPGDPARVVNIGSVAGVKVERLSAYSYSASKAAVHMLGRELAADLAGEGITVNTIVPGYFPTRMTAHLRTHDAVDPAILARIPLQRMGTADDIGGLLVFLCARAGAYVTGAQIPVDGGVTGCA